MKKLLLFLQLIILLAGCSKDDIKYCWNFQIKVTTTIYSGSEKTSSVFTNKKLCNLTESEANKIKEDIYNIKDKYENGYKVRVVTEVINMKKIDGYGMQIEKEKEIISDYIDENKISVISQSDFISSGYITDINKNQYVHLSSGAYMQIIDRGDIQDNNKIKNGKTIIASFSEYNIYSNEITLSNELSPFVYNETSYSISGQFVSGKMMEMYGSSVPAGFLVPLEYIYNGANIKLIIPSKLGHQKAIRDVIPYFYEMKIKSVQ